MPRRNRRKGQTTVFNYTSVNVTVTAKNDLRNKNKISRLQIST